MCKSVLLFLVFVLITGSASARTVGRVSPQSPSQRHSSSLDAITSTSTLGETRTWLRQKLRSLGPQKYRMMKATTVEVRYDSVELTGNKLSIRMTAKSTNEEARGESVVIQQVHFTIPLAEVDPTRIEIIEPQREEGNFPYGGVFFVVINMKGGKESIVTRSTVIASPQGKPDNNVVKNSDLELFFTERGAAELVAKAIAQAVRLVSRNAKSR
jgi:hypothetical protein